MTRMIIRTEFSDRISPTKSVIPVSHSSLHFNQNTQTINRLKLTEHPFILLSATFPMSFQICLQYLYLLTKVLRMKGGWDDNVGRFIHNRPPINRAFQRIMKGEKKKPTSDCRTERHSCFLWIKTTHLYNLVKAGANTAKPDYINEAVSKLKRPMTKLCLVILSFAKNLNTSTLCIQILHFIQNDNNTRLLKSFPVIIDSVHWCKWCALRMTELNDSIINV